MRNVIRRALKAGQGDRGAVGVLVGVLIASGVLFGMAAMVVDVGSIYAERAQLQTGADAGALAVAKACALGEPGCSVAGSYETAGPYADSNAKDGASAARVVCGFAGDSGDLEECPPSTGARVDCPEAPPSGTKYVDVHTSTISKDRSSTLLPPAFAHTLAGNESPDGATIGACSRAAWGPPSGANTVALTISLCEWWVATGGSPTGPAAEPDYAPPPPYPPNPDVSYDRVVKLHTPRTESDCPGGPAGSDGPGVFGWVDDPDSNCSAHVEDEWYDAGNTGAGTDFPPSCEEVLAKAWANKTPIYIPVYDETDEETGSRGSYHLEGFAAFVVTGYHLTGAPSRHRSDWLEPTNDCSGAERCINGFFTQDLIPGPGSVGGPDMGLTIIKLTG